LRPQNRKFIWCKLKCKICRKSLLIATNGLIKSSRLHTEKRRQIGIKHDFLPTNSMDFRQYYFVIFFSIG